MSFGRTALLQSAAREVWQEVRSTFTGAGIPCLPVKGLVTARWLYADPAEREISDIDVRIRPRDRQRARQVGLDRGWQLAFESRVYAQLQFTVGGLDVDVECSVGPPGYVRLPVDTLLERASPSSQPGLTELGPLLDPYDHAVLLVVNAVKDHLVDASAWALEDLRRVIRLPDFEHEALVHRAADVGALGMLLSTARYLGRDDAAWLDLTARIEGRDHPRLHPALFDVLVRRGGPRWALRIGARLGPDEALRSLTSLLRALAWEAEQHAHRVVAPSPPRVA